MNKKIIKLNGGLGNQMFQYAFALVVANKFNIEVLFDFSHFEEVKSVDNVTTRVFELDAFGLECKEASIQDLENIKYPEIKKLFKKNLVKFFPKIFGITYVREKYAYCYDKSIFKNPDFIFYEGYFQNEKYFKHLRAELLKKFSLKAPLDEKNLEVLDRIKNTESVSIHIRRGDYVLLDYVNKIHGTCSLEYYKKAVEYISKKVKSPHFYIFSDDIDWVLENFKLEHPFTVVDFNQGMGCFDLELMKNCKHNIIANSSFSWWGAWLNQNSEKIVIAPKKWTVKKQKTDIIPPKWIRL